MTPNSYTSFLIPRVYNTRNEYGTQYERSNVNGISQFYRKLQAKCLNASFYELVRELA